MPGGEARLIQLRAGEEVPQPVRVRTDGTTLEERRKLPKHPGLVCVRC